jgi:hypothetical protein
MIVLQPGYNEIVWTGPPQPLQGLPWLPIISRAYGRNLVTGSGFIGYSRGDLFPSLSMLSTGANYLLFVTESYTLAAADAATTGTFPAFNGYVPAVTTPPVVPQTGPGFIATGVAAVSIIGGMLVARTMAGLVPYDTSSLNLIHLLFGVALNSAAPGGAVSVQRGGYILYPGLGLPVDQTLFAGLGGRFSTNSRAMAFSQIVGRAISPDELVYQPESLTILYPYSLSVL